VRYLKGLLNARLNPPPAPPLDETSPIFDAATKAQVQRWQTSNSLRCTEGIAGPETWNSIAGTNQTGGCATVTPPTPPGPPTPPTPPAPITPSEDCNKLLKNFQDFGGSAPDVLSNNCYSSGQAIDRAITLAFALVGILAVLFIVIGGFRYITSGGNDAQAASGKKTMTWAVIGLIMVLVAYTIIRVVTRVINTGSIF
jgi:hypothetical protein